MGRRGHGLYAIWVVILMVCGCPSRDSYPITGIVCADTDSEIVESYLLGIDNIPEGCKPIPAADVYLSFDRQGKQNVKGFAAKSDEDGRYEIKVKGIPRSETEYGNDYYLVVKKKGYEPLIREISIGPLSRYLHNTAVLKPIPKK